MAHDNMGRVPPATGVTARLSRIGTPLRQVERRPVEVVGEHLVPARNIADRHGGRRRRLPGDAPGDESYRNDHRGKDTGRDPCREPRPRSTLPSGATRGRARAVGGHLGAGDRDLLYRSGSCYERALTGRARRPHGSRAPRAHPLFAPCMRRQLARVDRRCTGHLRAGHFFGDVGLLDRGPNVTTGTVATPMDVVVFSWVEFRALLEVAPAAVVTILRAHAAYVRAGRDQPAGGPCASTLRSSESPEV